MLLVSPGFSQSQSGVSISFDRVVLPPLSRRDIDSAVLWLRLKNASHAPIQVFAGASEDGAEGVEVVHEIVMTPAPPKSDPGKTGSGWISPPGSYSPIDEATTLDIRPDSDLRFSVPFNHVGPSWFLRITFQILHPKVRSGRQPQDTVDFTWADVPINARRAWKK